MPLVRIDLRKGKDAAYRQDIGRTVYEALISVSVPQNDRFQVVGEYEDDDFFFDPDYLGIHRSDDLVMIQITWNEGRTVEQKKALYKAVVDGLAAKPGIRPEDVLINLIEVKKENLRGAVRIVKRDIFLKKGDRHEFASPPGNALLGVGDVLGDVLGEAGIIPTPRGE